MERSPKKQNVIFQQQSSRIYRVDTPNSEDLEEESERRPFTRGVMHKFEMEKSTTSAFQSPNIGNGITARSLTNGIQQERRINNPLGTTTKIVLPPDFCLENSENIDPNTVRGRQIPLYLDSHKRQLTGLVHIVQQQDQRSRTKGLSHTQQIRSFRQSKKVMGHSGDDELMADDVYDIRGRFNFMR